VQQQDSTGTASGSGPDAPAPEEHITLAQAAKLAPGRPSSNCVWRWCREGVKAAHRARVQPARRARRRRAGAKRIEDAKRRHEDAVRELEETGR